MKLKLNPVTVLISLLLLSYPFIVHFNLLGKNILPVALVAGLVIIALMLGFRWIATVIVVLLLGTIGLFYAGHLQELSVLPPVVINMLFGVIFLFSLRKTQTPLIEKYIMLLEGKITDDEQQYARRLTLIWALVLFALMLESILLAMFASHETRSLFTNFLNYVILAIIFVSEYFVRLRIFPDKAHMSFFDYINRLRRINLKTVVM